MTPRSDFHARMTVADAAGVTMTTRERGMTAGCNRPAPRICHPPRSLTPDDPPYRD